MRPCLQCVVRPEAARAALLTWSVDSRQNAPRYDAITDVPGIKVGHWTDLRAATGCTVVLCEAGAVGGVDVRGGGPGTRETDLLRPGDLVQEVHAVLLTGGSAFGLDAAGGVMRWCEEHGVGLAFGGAVSRSSPARSSSTSVRRAAMCGRTRPRATRLPAAAKDGRVAEGSVGAGTGATVARRWACRGDEGRHRHGQRGRGVGLIVGAIVAVNAVGESRRQHERKSVVAGPRDSRGRFVPTRWTLSASGSDPPPGPTNTTIGVVATNARLTKEQTNRLATVAHDGYARAIRPVHTLADGDTIFALATGERELKGTRTCDCSRRLRPLAVERAIVKGVLAAKSLGGVPSISEWRERLQAT